MSDVKSEAARLREEARKLEEQAKRLAAAEATREAVPRWAEGLPPSCASLCPTAPGAGWLGFPSRKSARAAFQATQESFGRRPDRIAPREPSAPSAALRCYLNRSSPTQDADFQSAWAHRSKPRSARRLRRSQGREL